MRSIAGLLAATALVLVPRIAAAQAEAAAGGSEATGLGVGIQAMAGTADLDVPIGLGITETIPLGVAGPAVTYQTPQFHIDGILSFASNGATLIGAGGRFFYELHSTQASDLSIGGGLGFVNISIDSDGDDDFSETLLQFEVGAKVRAFLAPSVAVNASVGLGLISGDIDYTSFSGQLVGGIGLTYFFF